MPATLTTRKLAERLGVQPGTIRHWRRCGGGPKYMRRGKSKFARALYLETDVEEYESKLAGRRFGSTDEENAAK